MKKVVVVLTAAALLTLPIAASANTDVKVNASIEPAGSLAFNFDAMQINGKVGNRDNLGQPLKGGAEVWDDGPNFKVTSNQYYELLVSGTDLTTKPTAGSAPVVLSSKRMEIGVDYQMPVQVTSTPTQVAYGYGMKTAEKHYIKFNLNLENSLNGVDMLSAIQSPMNFESTVTFSFTSM